MINQDSPNPTTDNEILALLAEVDREESQENEAARDAARLERRRGRDARHNRLRSID